MIRYDTLTLPLLVYFAMTSIFVNGLNPITDRKGVEITSFKCLSSKIVNKNYIWKSSRRRRKDRDEAQWTNTIYTNSLTNNNDILIRCRGGAILTNRTGMYAVCAAITFIWISIATLFYSKYYDWPLPQSFFYAVDAGMSIGFCTDVAETRVGSRAFTIVHILLGASCVGGALALFIKDIVEGVVDLKHGKYEELLARNALMRFSDCEGLSYPQFRALVNEWSSCDDINDKDFAKLCQRFDAKNGGYIDFETFLNHYDDMDTLLETSGFLYSDYTIVRNMAQLWKVFVNLWRGRNRIFTVCILWIILGVSYGSFAMGWDIITSTHFAVSALATGGLTAPQVDSNGYLPTGPSLFCGFYCLFGIPLFALTLGYFARILVERHILSAEIKAMMKPISLSEYEYAKHLTTSDDSVHLSDFIVLQLLRQRKVDTETVNMIKARFHALDSDKSGVLTYEQATESK